MLIKNKELTSDEHLNFDDETDRHDKLVASHLVPNTSRIGQYYPIAHEAILKS